MSNELRNAFTVISVPDLQEVIEQVSRSLIDWSHSVPDAQARIPGGSPLPSKYASQPSHVLLNEKVSKHNALLRTLECAVRSYRDAEVLVLRYIICTYLFDYLTGCLQYLPRSKG